MARDERKLGSLIRQKRLELEMSQETLCGFLEWTDISRLREIEQGKARPDMDRLRTLIFHLGFDAAEEGKALLLSGYPPTDADIRRWLPHLKEQVKSWGDPSYAIDATWKLLYANEPARTMFRLPKERVEAERLNLFEWVLEHEPTAELFESVPNWQSFLAVQVATFRVENIRSSAEPWFRELLAKLGRNETFRRLWSEVADASLREVVRKMRGHDLLLLPDAKSGKAKSHMVLLFPLQQDQRFRVRVLVPVKADVEKLTGIHLPHQTVTLSK